MTSDIKLEKFEGPLDLLLQLIEQEKMDITEIALSEVTEQFLAQLEKIESDREEELAGFLVIATRLVYLKSKQLLPHLCDEEESGPSLADQLKLYKQFVEASKNIGELWDEGRLSYGRFEPPVKPASFVLPASSGLNDLRQSFENLLARLKPINPLPKIEIDRGVTVKERITSIMEALKRAKRINFSALFSQSSNRTEVIVSFLAILDLCREAKAAVSQSKTFSDLELRLI